MTTHHSHRRPRPQACWTRFLNEPTLLPAGQDWDAIRTTASLGTRAMRYLELCGAPVGPVLHDRGSDQLYFLTPPGTARTWQREHTRALGPGTWVVLAPPGWNGGLLRWLADPADSPAHTAPDHLAQALTIVTTEPYTKARPGDLQC